MGGHRTEDLGQACTFLAKAALIKGILRPLGEMREDGIHRRKGSCRSGHGQAELGKRLRLTEGDRNDRFTAAVRAGKDVGTISSAIERATDAL